MHGPVKDPEVIIAARRAASSCPATRAGTLIEAVWPESA
jgi:hypothetical protein